MNVAPHATEELAQEIRLPGAVEAVKSPTLTTRTLASWQELDALREPWEALLGDSDGPTIFSTPEWLGAWWRAFASDKQIASLAFANSGGELAGLAPLYRDRLAGPLGYPLRRIRFVGDGSLDSDNLDLVIARGNEQRCVHALFDWLQADSGWDVCELNTLPLDSASLPEIQRQLKDRQWTLRQSETPRSTITLPETWEKYLASISKKEKTKINYYTNRLKRRFEVGFSRCADPAELPASLESLFELHQKRWVLRGEPGSFASAERRKFYYEMAAAFLERKWLEFWLLKLDGKTVAAQYGFRYRDAVYSLQEGFDPALSPDRVGYLLRAHALKTLIGEGVRQYDFLGGEDPSKDRWGAQLLRYVNLQFARPHSLGSGYIKLDAAALDSKNWAKANLPAPAFRVAQRVYHALRGTTPPVDGAKPKHVEDAGPRRAAGAESPTAPESAAGEFKSPEDQE